MRSLANLLSNAATVSRLLSEKTDVYSGYHCFAWVDLCPHSAAIPLPSPHRDPIVSLSPTEQLLIKRALILIVLLASSASAQYSQPVDARSYNLGIIGGFAEVVRLGVKTLALSEVMTPEEMDDILADAEVVAKRNGVELYRESALIVTDLYPPDVAVGLDVLLIYTGDTLEKYLRLKEEQSALLNAGRYDSDAREDIARRFGRLLSYPEPVIDRLIAAQRRNNRD